MADFVSHIICALMVLNSGMIDVKDYKKFIVGTSINDIRYLGAIKREQTHPSPVTWRMVQDEPDPFKAGMSLHALVDVARVDYLEKRLEHTIPLYVPFRSQTLKFFEGRQLYDWCDDWQKIASYFNEILPEERALGIDDKRLQKMAQNYSGIYQQKSLTTTFDQIY